ncbi:MAG: hypothetical protein HY716_01730 [Planctomycetes bacterium]|nr:hypothetical protein [Planctomycetota bacterium]
MLRTLRFEIPAILIGALWAGCGGEEPVPLSDTSSMEFDWFAQDKDGNVWYFGEDSKEIEDGVVVSTEGSWEAGVGGAQPGILMLADPKVGISYQQEFAEGVAEDMARVKSLSESVTVPVGTFEGCIETMEWTPLEPGARESKFYAPGVGLVLEVSLRGGGARIELVEIAN